MLFHIQMIDRPGGAALRAATSEAHLAFVGQHVESMYAGGPLVSDDGERTIGSLVVMDFEDRAAAEAFIAEEPYNKAGLFESVMIRAYRPVVPPTP